MKKVRITVVKCGWNQDLVDRYASPGLTPCQYNREGMTFVSNGWQKPEGLCDNAWKSMMEYVLALSHGAEDFYDGELKDRRAFIASCNDGFRPVSYLIEALDEDVTDMFEDNPEVRRRSHLKKEASRRTPSVRSERKAALDA